MLKRKYQWIKYILFFSIIFIFYKKFIITTKDRDETYNQYDSEKIKEVILDFNSNIEENLDKSKKDEMHIENKRLNSIDKLFEPDQNLNQYKLYMKYKKTSNSNKDSATYLETKKYLEKFQIRKQKDYFLILEFTQVFFKKKFCELEIKKPYIDLVRDQDILDLFSKEKNASNPIKYDALDNCYYKNCFFTCDKSLVSKSDALLFHEYDLKLKINKIGSDPDYSIVYSALFNFERDLNQLWILWNDEANEVKQIMDDFRFNWTISYNSKSEASYCTYGCLSRLEKTLEENEFVTFAQKEFKDRKKNAVWFVSNCKAKSRLKFAARLGRTYPIELYGKCGSIMLSSFADMKAIKFNEAGCPSGSACEQNVFKSNKFYLAFENTNCTDYITEKFWRALDNNLIPVVIQPNKESYERVAPKDSFIHASDFDYDYTKLSDYLDKVSSDLVLYSKYFQWKKYYKVMYKGKKLEQLRMCELCERLNNLQNFYNSYYENLSSWFNRQCTRNPLDPIDQS